MFQPAALCLDLHVSTDDPDVLHWDELASLGSALRIKDVWNKHNASVLVHRSFGRALLIGTGQGIFCFFDIVLVKQVQVSKALLELKMNLGKWLS